MNNGQGELKGSVKGYWEKVPCGAGDVETLEEGSLEFFETVEQQRYGGDSFMFDVVGFNEWRGKRVLEVGCGLGTDLLQFARGGAEVYGIDLTQKGARLARKRLALYGQKGNTLVGDSENLPFPDNYFDLVYSWGVIHHTPDTEKAAREIMRVCKPGGRVQVMIYHRRSLLALQSWIVYGLLRGAPQRSASEIIAHHVESPGTKSYTPDEALKLFEGLKDTRVQRVVTRYDLRLGRRLFLPTWIRSIVPSQLGWFMIVNGTKV
ncbi:MAG: class I SAM-dependent methyltransferase [Pyrinomonadaceae bacterium]